MTGAAVTKLRKFSTKRSAVGMDEPGGSRSTSWRMVDVQDPARRNSGLPGTLYRANAAELQRHRATS